MDENECEEKVTDGANQMLTKWPPVSLFFPLNKLFKLKLTYVFPLEQFAVSIFLRSILTLRIQSGARTLITPPPESMESQSQRS